MKFSLVSIYVFASIFAFFLSCAMGDTIEVDLVGVDGLMGNDEIAFLDSTLIDAINALQNPQITDADLIDQEFHQGDRRSKLRVPATKIDSGWGKYSSYNWLGGSVVIDGSCQFCLLLASSSSPSPSSHLLRLGATKEDLEDFLFQELHDSSFSFFQDLVEVHVFPLSSSFPPKPSMI